MKTTLTLSLFLAFTATLALPLYGMKKLTTPATIVKDIRVSLERANKQAGKRIAEAIKAKNSIAKSRMRESVKTIKIAEQDEIIATTKQELLQLAENAIKIADETKKEENYLSQFMTGAQNLGAKAKSLFEGGYGYSEQEKALARATIAELENLKEKESDPKIIQELEKEIYAQKLISGDKMGLQQKLLIGAAITAAGIAGVALTSHYLGAGAPSEPSTPNITPPSQKPVQESIVTEEPAPVQILPPSNITVERVGEGRVEEPKKVDPIDAALEISSKLKEAHAEEQIAEEQKNIAEKDLENTQAYKDYEKKYEELVLGGATPEELDAQYEAVAQSPEFTTEYSPAYGAYEAALGKEKDLQEQLSSAEQNINEQLRKISQLFQEKDKAEYVGAFPSAEYDLKKDPQWIHYQQVLKNFKAGTATEEEKNSAYNAMIATDAYKNYIEEPKKRNNAWKTAYSIRKQLDAEPKSLVELIKKRHEFLGKKWLRHSYKDWKEADQKYPIDYSAEQLSNIKQLENEYMQAQTDHFAAAKEVDLMKASLRYGSEGQEFRDFFKLHDDWELGLASDEDTKIALEKLESTEIWQQYRAALKQRDKAAAKEKELEPKLIEALKASPPKPVEPTSAAVIPTVTTVTTAKISAEEPELSETPASQGESSTTEKEALVTPEPQQPTTPSTVATGIPEDRLKIEADAIEKRQSELETELTDAEQATFKIPEWETFKAALKEFRTECKKTGECTEDNWKEKEELAMESGVLREAYQKFLNSEGVQKRERLRDEKRTLQDKRWEIQKQLNNIQQLEAKFNQLYTEFNKTKEQVLELERSAITTKQKETKADEELDKALEEFKNNCVKSGECTEENWPEKKLSALIEGGELHELCQNAVKLIREKRHAIDEIEGLKSKERKLLQQMDEIRQQQQQATENPAAKER